MNKHWVYPAYYSQSMQQPKFTLHLKPNEELRLESCAYSLVHMGIGMMVPRVPEADRFPAGQWQYEGSYLWRSEWGVGSIHILLRTVFLYFFFPNMLNVPAQTNLCIPVKWLKILMSA